MAREYTVQERYDIVLKALPKHEKLTKTTTRDLEEIIYTASEAGAFGDYRFSAEEALFAWQLVELAKRGGVTEEMRL